MGLVDDLSESLGHWALPPIATVVAAPLGTMNETFIVQLTDRRVVLKRHRTGDTAAVGREHALIGHASDHGIPVPPAIATSDGLPFVSIDGKLYSLFEHASGQQVDRESISLTQAQELGLMLARLHAALVDGSPVQVCRADPTLPSTTEGTAEHLEMLLRLAEGRPVVQESDAWAVQRLRSRLAILGGRPQERPPVLFSGAADDPRRLPGVERIFRRVRFGMCGDRLGQLKESASGA